MVMRASSVLTLAHRNFPSFLRQRLHVERLDSWHRGEVPEGEGVFRPNTAERGGEYDELREKAHTPWLSLVTTSAAQAMYVDGVRRGGTTDLLNSWDAWQENSWDARQGPLYRATMAHGLAYAVALPARARFGGGLTAHMRPVSARSMAAFYDDDDDDDYPTIALRAEKYKNGDEYGIVTEEGWTVRLYDETAIYYLSCRGDGQDRDDWTYITHEEHDLGVTPVVRYANTLDLDGRATGEVEPLIPLARRIDQDTFDRLIVQRFGAWKVRYIAGMAKPSTAEAEAIQKMRLRVEDILISTNKDTKFGTLDETQLEGFIRARDADIRDFAAISQTPPHYLLGSLVNLSAEALAAAEASLMRKIAERRVSFGESHERLFRLAAYIRGDAAEARAFDMEVRWRDMESRSLAQAADALGKLVTMVGVPPEMAMERIPGWTDTDVARAKELLESGTMDSLFEQLDRSVGQGEPPGVAGRQPGQA